MAGKGVVRSLKNYAKGFSDTQILVRNATSNDSWGPSGTLMNEIAQMTYNPQDFIEVMDMIDKRLNDKGKNWKHVFKALLLLDYCLHVGSENVVLYAKENAYVVKTLKEFQHVEENGKDVGANVRQKAKDIANLLQDDNRLREERRQRQQMRDRMAGVGDYMGELTGMKSDGAPNRDGNTMSNDDLELLKAMEESKRLAAKEEQKRKQGEEDDLAVALQLSEQEASEKAKNQSSSSTNADFDALFNTYPQQPQQQQQTPLQIGWTSEPTANVSTNSNSQFFDNSTLNNATFQSANNPYLQQQQQQVFQQSTFQPTQFQHSQVVSAPASFANMQPQHQPQSAFGTTAFTDNTQQQQQQHSPFGQQQQQQQQQQLTPFGTAPFQTSMVTGSRNPFSQQQQLQPQPSSQGSQVFAAFAQQQPLSSEPQPPSSPFAIRQPSTPLSPFSNYQSTSPSIDFSKTDSTSSPTATSLHPIGSSTLSTPSSPSTAGQSRPFAAKTNDDPRYEKLNSLLGSKDDGMDTFGNTGSLRVPFGTGFANTIKPQENGDMVKAGNTTTTTKDGFDAAFGFVSSPGLINTGQQQPQEQQQQNKTDRNPFGTNENVFTPSSNPLSSPFYT